VWLKNAAYCLRVSSVVCGVGFEYAGDVAARVTRLKINC
jgi:hypothetical protein